MQYICIWLPICQAGSHCVHYLADGLGISVRSPSLQLGCFSVPPVVLTVGEALPPIRGETAIAVIVMGRVKERTLHDFRPLAITAGMGSAMPPPAVPYRFASRSTSARMFARFFGDCARSRAPVRTVLALMPSKKAVAEAK